MPKTVTLSIIFVTRLSLKTNSSGKEEVALLLYTFLLYSDFESWNPAPYLNCSAPDLIHRLASRFTNNEHTNEARIPPRLHVMSGVGYTQYLPRGPTSGGGLAVLSLLGGHVHHPSLGSRIFS